MLKKGLTLALPTYNRSRHAARQLSALISQCQGLDESVRILVSNNASTDDTRQALDALAGDARVKIIHQEKNLGMEGNFQYLINHVATSHVWMTGDDDYLDDGLVKEVVLALRHDTEPAWVHIRHMFKSGRDGRITVPDLNPLLKEGFYADGEELLKRVIDVEGSGLYITANVYPTGPAQALLSEWQYNRAMPMALTVRAGISGPGYFVKKHSVYGTSQDIHDAWMADPTYERIYTHDSFEAIRAGAMGIKTPAWVWKNIHARRLLNPLTRREYRHHSSARHALRFTMGCAFAKPSVAWHALMLVFSRFTIGVAKRIITATDRLEQKLFGKTC